MSLATPGTHHRALVAHRLSLISHGALAARRRALTARRRALVTRRRALSTRCRALAELSLLVAKLSLLVAELSPLEPRLQPCSGTGLENIACLIPPSTLYSSTTLGDLSTTPHAVLEDCLLDHLTSAQGLPSRPPDQRSGTSSSTTRPALGDCAFDHPISARGFVDRVSCCARGLLRPLFDHSLRPTARALISSATCEI
jgi:hypothetical protein